MAITETPSTATSAAHVWHVLSREGAVRELGVEPERGLTSEDAAERLERYGPNRFAEAKAEPRWHAFLRQYQDPMQIVLLIAGVISIYPVKQPGTGIVILLLTLLNAVLGLSQEGKAAAAVAALQKMMIVKARVRRDETPSGGTPCSHRKRGNMKRLFASAAIVAIAAIGDK